MPNGRTMQSLIVTAVVGGASLLVMPAAQADPPEYKRACAPIQASGTSLTVDILQGKTRCPAAQKVIRAYAAGKHTPRTLKVNGIRWKCAAAGPKAIKSGLPSWRYVCNTKGFASAVAGGRLLPDSVYLNN
jgi:hypothetical protein